MALADVEGARIHLKELTIAHHMASWESIQEILMRHYTRQILHEMYKVTMGYLCSGFVCSQVFSAWLIINRYLQLSTPLMQLVL